MFTAFFFFSVAIAITVGYLFGEHGYHTATKQHRKVVLSQQEIIDRLTIEVNGYRQEYKDKVNMLAAELGATEI